MNHTEALRIELKACLIEIDGIVRNDGSYRRWVDLKRRASELDEELRQLVEPQRLRLEIRGEVERPLLPEGMEKSAVVVRVTEVFTDAYEPIDEMNVDVYSQVPSLPHSANRDGYHVGSFRYRRSNGELIEGHTASFTHFNRPALAASIAKALSELD